MTTDLISVIIPVYNVRPYLEKAVNSVIGQTYQNLEIILVDDGSTDGSAEICDSFKRLDNRITVVHQRNQGLSVARNIGIDFAKGQWIAFLDSDDWIKPEMYQVLHDLAIKGKADIVSCMSCRCESSITPAVEGDGSVITMDSDQIIEGLVSNQIVLFEVWNKLWKKTLIGRTRFIPGQVSEDVHFDRILFMKAKRFIHINRVYHNYLVNRPGNTNSTFKEKRLCIFDEFDQWYKELLCCNKNHQGDMIAVIAAQFAIHIYEEAIEKNARKEIKEFMVREFKKNNSRITGPKMYYGNYRFKALIMSLMPTLYQKLWQIRIKFVM